MTYYCKECHRILDVESTMNDKCGHMNGVVFTCIKHGTISLDDKILNCKALSDKLNLYVKCNKGSK